jgi:SGNH domain (fused to AT3 domains)
MAATSARGGVSSRPARDLRPVSAIERWTPTPLESVISEDAIAGGQAEPDRLADSLKRSQGEQEMVQRNRHRWLIIGTVAFAILIVVTACGSVSTATGAASARRAPSVASTAQVLQAVSTAPSITSAPSDITPSLQDVTEDPYFNLLNQNGCDPAFASSTVGKCVFGDPKGSKTIVLLGDQRAAMWFPGFDNMAKQARWKLVVLMKTVCPAVDLSFWNWTTGSAYTACDQWHQYVTSRINEMDPAVVVFMSWWHGDGILPTGQAPTDAQWLLGLAQMVRSITSPGTKKVIWGDIAYLNQVGPTCLAANEDNVQACSTPASQAALTDHEQTLQVAAQGTGALYVSTIPWLCSSTCTAVIGKYQVYENSSDITSDYAAYLQGAIAEALRPVMGVTGRPRERPRSSH